MWDTYSVHGIPVLLAHARWSFIFRSFATSSQRLKTALSVVYNNNNNIYIRLTFIFLGAYILLCVW